MKFKVRSLEFGVWSFLIFILLVTVPLSLSTAGEKWSGVDESVIEKVAKEHGRKAEEPLLNTGRGNLLLFVSLLAGALGGFVGGYCWRTLTEKRGNRIESLKKDI
jgi:hypothetical protein